MSENQKSPMPPDVRREMSRRKFLIGVNAAFSALSTILGLSAASLGHPGLTEPLIGFGVAGGLGIFVQMENYFKAERTHGIDVPPSMQDRSEVREKTKEIRKNPIRRFRKEKDTLGDNIGGTNPKDMEGPKDKFGGD
jgi:hypothetical protein